MKKTILALIVLLTAALVFTGCEPDPGSLGLNGTWTYTKNVGSHTAYLGKIAITDSTAKVYAPTFNYIGQALFWDEIIAACPTAIWPDQDWSDPETCTVALNGNTITFTYADGDTMTATLSSNKKSFTTSDFNNSTATFKR